jgi:alpha-beta hydrolase superfamily lysophospholipase
VVARVGQRLGDQLDGAVLLAPMLSVDQGLLLILFVFMTTVIMTLSTKSLRPKIQSITRISTMCSFYMPTTFSIVLER